MCPGLSAASCNDAELPDVAGSDARSIGNRCLLIGVAKRGWSSPSGNSTAPWKRFVPDGESATTGGIDQSLDRQAAARSAGLPKTKIATNAARWLAARDNTHDDCKKNICHGRKEMPFPKGIVEAPCCQCLKDPQHIARGGH